ncbi:hypothetical protein EBB59_06575 [Lysobacter pythonis]|uniref:Uncharacterized protein n=1 Tax=Solilutibacter pythonis TaxID=2483112 RepID=A0A3M2I4P0_9GAMM|nr:hypothetical protein [Lysobacter pythonis]RMH93194.1 hypothetical protein EBB59_06575 [Lysobacter pythonis]
MSDSDTRLDQATHARIFSEKVIPKSTFPDATPQIQPKAIILAGQPDASKDRLARVEYSRYPPTLARRLEAGRFE